jgi:hypothetical protein
LLSLREIFISGVLKANTQSSLILNPIESSPFWCLSPAYISSQPVNSAHLDNNKSSVLENKVTSSITNCFGASLVINLIELSTNSG